MEFILKQVYHHNAEVIKKDYPDLFKKTREIYSKDYGCNILIIDTTVEEIVEVSKKIEEEFVIASNNYISEDYPVLEIYDTWRE